MLGKYLKDSVKVITGVATAASLHGYYKSINDQNLQREYFNLLESYKNLENKVNEANINELNTELMKTKLEVLKERLNVDNANALNEIKTLESIDPDKLGGNTDIKTHLGNFISESKKSNSTINEIVDLLSGNTKSNFWGSGKGSNSMTDLLNNWNNMLSNLTLEQLGALSHLLASIFILFCLFTIIIIVYSNILLDYYKIEEKYPKIGRYIRVRKLFQHYYLFLNFSLIIITLIAVIFINYKVLF